MSDDHEGRAALIRSLGLPPETDPMAHLREEIARVRDRDSNVQGVPMLLILEDLTGGEPPATGDPAVNARLAGAIDLLLAAQQVEVAGVPEIAAALEVVASRWAGLGAPPRGEAPSPREPDGSQRAG